MQLFLTTCALVTCVSVAHAEPPVFTSKSFEAAKSQAKAQGKILLVDATASWCPPCRRMERETWSDPAVRAWLAANAVAFQFDVDQNPKLTRALEVRSMPTLIIFEAGKETRRSSGYLSPAGILRWLKGGKATTDTAHLRQSINEARARTEAMSKLLKPGAQGEKVDIQVRLEQARKTGQSDPANAAVQYQWLWNNMLQHNPAMHNVRLTYMANEMQRLAARSEPALAIFTAMRDAAEQRLTTTVGRAALITDWLTLNRVIDDDARSLSWFDRVKDDNAAQADLRANDTELCRILEDANRWADLGRFYDEPVTQAQRVIDRVAENLRYVQPSNIAEATRYSHESTRETLSVMYAALLAADREAEADQILKSLIAFSDTPESRRALVSRALQADEPREHHLTLLDQADAASTPSDAALRDRLKTVLSASVLPAVDPAK